MLLTPRYDGPPVLRFEGPGDISAPLLRQRRRLGATLGALDDEQWDTPSRCEHWSVRDVASHLVTVDQFWAVSITRGLAGEPTRFLTGFDPVATPADLVDGMRTRSAGDVLADYQAGLEQLAALLDGLDAEGWDVVAESPPGHVPMHALARHALWDAWIHERDVVIPLGLQPVVEPDEVQLSLQYVAALAPALYRTTGSNRTGTLAVDGIGPDVHVLVEAGETIVVSDRPTPPGAAVVTGPSVELVEALSFRAALSFDIDPDDRWLLDGLATAFDLEQP